MKSKCCKGLIRILFENAHYNLTGITVSSCSFSKHPMAFTIPPSSGLHGQLRLRNPLWRQPAWTLKKIMFKFNIIQWGLSHKVICKGEGGKVRRCLLWDTVTQHGPLPLRARSVAGCHVIRRPRSARMSTVICWLIPGQSHSSSSVSSG